MAGASADQDTYEFEDQAGRSVRGREKEMEPRMRICFLADAGSQNTRTWAEYFAEKLGHEVHVISVNTCSRMAPSVNSIHLGSENGTARTRGKLGYLTNIKRIGEIVEDLSPDLVIGYRVASYGYLGARIRFHPFVVAAQGAYIVSPPHSLPKRMFARTALRAADLINSWAPHMTKRMIRLGAAPSKIITCPRGVDLDTFRPRKSDEECEFTLVSTRALHKSYGVDTIIRAVAIVAEKMPSTSVRLVGGGAEAENLRALAAGFGLGDRVRFEGRVDYERLPELLGKSEVYVSSVGTDGVSASLLEAMALGCFPIVKDNVANRQWIDHGKNGLLVDRVTPENYATAILEAISNESMRRSAAVANRSIVEERADLDKNMRKFEAAYLNLIDAARGPRPADARGRERPSRARRPVTRRSLSSR